MELSRRAVFFTITAFVFLALLFVVLSIGLNDNHLDTGLSSAAVMEATRTRFDDHYAPLVLRYAAYSTFVALTKDSVVNNRDLILPGDFTEAIMTGSYRTHPLTLTTLPAAFTAFAQATQNAGIANLSITVQQVSIAQTGTFFAHATARINYTLLSRDGSISYNRTIDIASDLSLVGITDTLYARKSSGTAFNENRTFHIFARKSWNNTEFDRFWAEGSYIADNRSPSIFSRLQGLNQADAYGIMTSIPRSVTPPNNRTAIDAEYFLPIDDPCRYYTAADPTLRLSWNRTYTFNITSSALVAPGTGCPAPPFS